MGPAERIGERHRGVEGGNLGTRNPDGPVHAGVYGVGDAVDGNRLGVESAVLAAAKPARLDRSRGIEFTDLRRILEHGAGLGVLALRVLVPLPGVERLVLDREHRVGLRGLVVDGDGDGDLLVVIDSQLRTGGTADREGVLGLVRELVRRIVEGIRDGQRAILGLAGRGENGPHDLILVGSTDKRSGLPRHLQPILWTHAVSDTERVVQLGARGQQLIRRGPVGDAVDLQRVPRGTGINGDVEHASVILFAQGDRATRKVADILGGAVRVDLVVELDGPGTGDDLLAFRRGIREHSRNAHVSVGQRLARQVDGPRDGPVIAVQTAGLRVLGRQRGDATNATVFAGQTNLNRIAARNLELNVLVGGALVGGDVKLPLAVHIGLILDLIVERARQGLGTGIDGACAIRASIRTHEREIGDRGRAEDGRQRNLERLAAHRIIGGTPRALDQRGIARLQLLARVGVIDYLGDVDLDAAGRRGARPCHPRRGFGSNRGATRELGGDV